MKYEKIFIISPSNHVTGGPQTLHQLCDEINRKNYSKAYIYYMDESSEVMKSYSDYLINVATKIEDSESNLLIVPEGITYYLNRYKRISKAIWWLAWDYYLRSDCKYRAKAYVERKKLPKFLAPIITLFLKTIKKEGNIYNFNDDNRYFHFYNCEYIHIFLLEKGIADDHTMYLCGPLSDLYFNQIGERKKMNVVCYNPSKGGAFSKEIINYFSEKKSDVQFVGLKNMSQQEVCLALKSAKVYMDFGYFPGPERIPREAVMLGCNIITSRNGSAANNEDIKIPDCFKFSDDIENLESIYNCINDLLNNYEENFHLYDAYREKVIKQREQFYNNIKNFFS